MAIGDQITEENIAETAPRGWDSEPEYYASIGRGCCGLIAELEKAKRELEREKETIRRKTEAMRAKLEKETRELERSKSEKEEKKREYEAWLQSENIEMPMFPLLEGPEQSAPTTVTLAAEAPAAEVMTDTRVFPDTAAPDASVERADIKLTSAAGPSSKICGESRAFRYYNSSCPKHGSNSNSSNSSKSSGNDGSSSSSNDTTSNYGPWCDTGALLRPFDPGKGCRRGARRGRAVLGADLPFDRGKA